MLKMAANLNLHQEFAISLIRSSALNYSSCTFSFVNVLGSFSSDKQPIKSRRNEINNGSELYAEYQFFFSRALNAP